MSPALPVLITLPSDAVFLSPKVMSPKSRLTPPCWTSWPASGLRKWGSLLLSTSLWLSVSLLLQAVDRIATAVDDRGGRHRGGNRVHLSRRDVLHAGVLHGLVGVVEEGLG